jgi:O-antigen ligase
MTDRQTKAGRLLDGAILTFLFLFAAAAPNSIAATQTAWLIGMLLWLVRFAFRPRPKLYRTPVDYLILGFFILTGLSAFLSYEPMVSIGKLRAASLFTIIYLFAENVPSLRISRHLGIVLICSCMVNVFFTAGQFLLGRAVKVSNVAQNSPLYRAGIRDGDTMLEVDGQKLHDPQEVVNALSKPDQHPAAIHVYRHELQPVFKVPRGTLLTGSDPLAQLGIGSWSRGRDWRATGFYGQFVTYAEVLQLIFALTLGMLLSLPVKRSWVGALLLVALAGFAGALLLTVTRASWAGCAVSTLLIFLLSIRRRGLFIAGGLAIPLVLAGLFVLQQKRNVAFIDQTDQSTTWRETVWREGVHLLVSKPRHLLVGVGMDSIKGHWRQWGMFDGGRIPWGHMHSNLLQIALERGVPALLLWFALLFVYARTLWRALRTRSSSDGVMETTMPQKSNRSLYWIERGILLGALGGLAGFFTSGLVHYNWGDSEVVMVFYMIMGMSLAIVRLINQEDNSAI